MDYKIEYNVNIDGEQYVGIKLSEENKIKVFLPIGYRYDELEVDSKLFKQQIKKLFKLLARKQSNGYIKNDSNNEFSLIAAIKVIENYMEYGLYKQTEEQKKMNSNGKIDWHKTINSKKTYLKDKIIYNNIYYTKMNYNAEKEIQNIQKICLNAICKIIGIYWGIFINEEIREKYNKNEMIHIIQKEIKNLNQDKKLEILNNLLNFIKNVNFDKLKKGNISFKYKEFEYIWQKLIDIQGIKSKEKQKYQPVAGYYNFEGTMKRKVNPSLPDTIMIDDINEIVFILDAKYYKIGNLPNEYDIFKQVRYGEYVKNFLKSEGKENYKIINSFILPKDLPKEKVVVEDYYAKLIDDVNLEEIKKENSYKIIFVTYVDTQKLIMDTQNIINEIKKNLSNKYKNIFG